MSRLTVTIALFAFAAAAVYFGVLPQGNAISQVRAEIEGLQTLSDELLGLAEQRDALTEVYNTIAEEDLQRLQSIVPKGGDTAPLLTDFENMARQNSVLLDRIDFSSGGETSRIGQTTGGRFEVISISMNVRGTYEAFRGFLASLERNLRVTDVQLINFGGLDVTPGATALFNLQGEIYYRP